MKLGKEIEEAEKKTIKAELTQQRVLRGQMQGLHLLLVTVNRGATSSLHLLDLILFLLRDLLHAQFRAQAVGGSVLVVQLYGAVDVAQRALGVSSLQQIRRSVGRIWEV